MKWGSMGEMPPSTSGSSGFSRRMAVAAATTISANIFQSGSSLKSQCERLFGSFHSMTASTMHAPLHNSWARLQGARQFVVQNVLAVPGDMRRLADPGFLLRMGRDCQARTAQHCFHGSAIGDPPVGGIARILVLNKVHAGKVPITEDFCVPKM